MELLLQLNNLPPLVFFFGGAVLGLLVTFLWTNRRSNNRVDQQRVASQLALDRLQQDLQSQLAELREHSLVLETHLGNKQQLLDQHVDVIKSMEQSEKALQRELSQQGATIASLRTELDQQRHAAEDKIAILQQAREQLTKDFELLGNRIFDEKVERFDKTSKATLDVALSPLKDQLKDFKRKVEDVYDKDSKERISLSAELGQLKQLNLQMSADALNLTNALKGDNKVQGNWGEVILERVLEESGLHKGREYDTQVNLKSADGQRRNPDVVIRLPENKDIIIDSKVSLVHYESYCSSDDDLQRQQALKDHINSVRQHISGLSFKDYESLEGIRTLDFVFIFIPIEAAFMAAFEHDSAMFKDAYEKNIIIVGPTTLLATLRTVQSIWRYERQNKNAEEIARQAGAMHDKFIGFVGDLEKISEYLQRAGQAQENAMNKLSQGKGNLVTSTQRLEKLGAKVKKTMPASVIDRDDTSNASIEQLQSVPESE